jgi:HPt (histidine-containing phosphotransfer) domain-containing protein
LPDSQPSIETPGPDHATTQTRLVSRLAKHPRFESIARRFALQLPHKLAEMNAALEAGQLQELAALAHWLKGAGGSIGFDDFFEPSKRLEEAALGGQTVEARRIMRSLFDLNARVQAPPEPEPATMDRITS